MDFQSLSIELLSQIVSFVAAAETPETGPYDPPRKPSLKDYACVSRQWQAIVERHTFNSIKLESTEIDRFRELFAIKRRQWILRHLQYSIILPTYSKNRCDKFENKKEKKQNDVAFSRAIFRLFKVLKTWEQGGTSNGKAGITINEQRRFNLHFNIYSPTDPYLRPIDFSHGMGSERMADSLLDFPKEHEKALPAISDIDEFSFESMRQVHLDAFSKILTAMPRLNNLELRFIQPKMKREALRHQQWRELGQMATTLAQSSTLKSLDLYSEFQEPFNHSFDPGDMRQPDSPVDQTSLALHNLAMLPGSSLQTLSLQGYFLISPQLFWPYDHDGSHLQLDRGFLSSNLEYIDILCNTHSPEGTWYYTGEPDTVSIDEEELYTRNFIVDDSSSNSDSDDSTNSEIPDFIDNRRDYVLNGEAPSHGWRLQIDEDTFDPLLTAMVRTTLHLPRLKKLSFTIGMDLREFRRVMVSCADSGQLISDEMPHMMESETPVRTWRVWVGMELSWELPAEIEAMMKEWVGEGGVVQKSHWPPHVPLDANIGLS